ncbi:U3 snoRNA associated-domain-containing protein [Aspergillus avenaceus]|uniref:U3 snoRNA associated-domain-containing protein n=1 Tax=Aspergillus avenaceus TaxID=36643 RepID=A0A5N6TQ23_ASPAV|nr:U3 snoRNA associated-domain-containing protein [Aspergillus avenaceus]
MVTATRRRRISDFPPEKEPVLEQLETNGKRKSGPANSKKADTTPRNKRRKQSNVEAAEAKEVASEDNTTSEPQEETESTPAAEEVEDVSPEPKEEANPAPAPKKHFRFDSEEPEVPMDTHVEETAETQQAQEDNSDDSDDDEAPETVDNSAQLSKIKLEAKKQEQARQLEEQAKRKKRRQLDELRKSQAKASKKKEKLSDDMLSESTVTLQGSSTQDTRRSALPALLPDDILNAAPVTRPPTPPAEGRSFAQIKPNKLKFLEKSEKRPRDVKMGDVTIRVLDDVPQKKAKSLLPPKASRSGRHSKQSWMDRNRSTGHVNGMRRTAGGTSSFVRK